MKNIAVFYGGKSVEHDISVITALQALAAKPYGYTFIPVYIMSDGKMVTGDNLFEGNIYLNFKKQALHVKEVILPSSRGEIWLLKGNKIKEKIKIDCALLCCHGHGGEDGSLQGMLEMAEIAYTSCNLPSSALCMDKHLTKSMLSLAKINTPKYVYMCKEEYEENSSVIEKNIFEKIGMPCIVKPACLGSSVGISICEDENMLDKQIRDAFKYDDKVIVEKFIQNAREFCCAVIKLGNVYLSSKVTEVKKGKFYTFEEKYLQAKTDDKKEINKKLVEKIKENAIESYQALLCDGVVRVDFLMDENNNLFVNELNAIPGSLAFNLFDIPFSDFLASLIKQGINRFNKKSEIVYKFNSDAIKKYIELSGRQKLK